MKRKYWILLIIIIGITIPVMIFILPLNENESVDEIEFAVTDSVPEPRLKYGITVDSFLIVHDTIKSGSSLSDLLRPYQVSLLTIDKIGRMSSDSFRVDRIRAGQPIAYFCNQDTVLGLKAEFMVYENNAIDYTVFDFRDSIAISLGEKPVEYIEKSVKGSIESSLWMALKNQNANTSLALEMSEMFGWVIDFFGIQKEDEFIIVYEEVVVEGKPIYVNRIIAGKMLHMGREYYAIPFTVDSVESFYEPDGASLRRTFLKAPLKYNRISSRYTHSRFHPILHKNTPHLAVDYSAPTGTPIRTIGDGVITLQRYGRGAGNYIKVKHNSVYSTVYMHMSRFGEFNLGERVKQGDIIGYVGSTGLSTGPHLHFEVHKNGQKIDPLKLESPPADPVPDSLMDEYVKVSDHWVEKIDGVE
ncbi:MAG: peptidoglycan DD-metalloendopeptidase family protein [Bacteroidota bacterium]|nr:peptidoglycan DD-metalloendopeptidase family protein [Bacteroidota bacterium]